MEQKKKNLPEVTLGQYKGLAVTRHVRPVTDKTVDIEVLHQTRMHAVYHPTTAPAKRGFRALLDFVGYMDGKEIPDSRMENVMVVLGDGKLMPAAEQAIYGHCAGEVFRFDFTYPQDFRLPELSGKTAQFEINLRSLAEKVTPAPDEAFAKSLGFGSLDALKADLRAKKQKIHEEGADRAAGKLLLDMAGANMTVALPAEILDRTARNEMKLLTERLSRSGITLEQHCKNSHTTPEALEKDYRAQAESRIRFVLAARAIAEAEGIVVHPEEVNAEYRRLSQLQDTPEAEIRKALAEDAVAAALAAKKVQRFLLDNAQVTTVTDAPEKEWYRYGSVYPLCHGCPDEDLPSRGGPPSVLEPPPPPHPLHRLQGHLPLRRRHLHPPQPRQGLGSLHRLRPLRLGLPLGLHRALARTGAAGHLAGRHRQ